MKMVVALASDFTYSTAAREFPVDVMISSASPMEASSRIYISAALLTKVGEEEAEFGYVRRVFPANQTVAVLLPGKPRHLRIDVLEHEDDFQGFAAADYRCDIKAEIYVKAEEGSKHVEFRESFIISMK